MSVTKSNGQAGTVSLIVLSASSVFLLAVTAVAALSQIGPFVCVVARTLGLPSLS